MSNEQLKDMGLRRDQIN
ncbi:DUF1127 domain-containing protein [Pseudomonas aeruginosa]